MVFSVPHSRMLTTARGDAAMYFGQMMKIRDGYLSQNLAALRSVDGDENKPEPAEKVNDSSDERPERLAYARKIDKMPEGFHPVYFKMWFPRILKSSFGLFGRFNAVLIVMGALAAIVLARRYAVLLLSAALMLIVFDSFYDKIVWRYLYLGSIFIVLAVAIPLLRALYHEGRNVLELNSRWQRTQEVQVELRNDFRPGDVFVTYDQDFRRWFELMDSGSGSAMKWGITTKRGPIYSPPRRVLIPRTPQSCWSLTRSCRPR